MLCDVIRILVKLFACKKVLIIKKYAKVGDP